MTTARTLSSSAIAEMLAEQTDEPWTPLITISHPDFAATLRYAARTQDFTHDGDTYVAAPFDVILATDVQRERPQGTIEVDGTDTTVLAALRAVATPVTFELRIVRDSDPNDVEVGPIVGEVRSIVYSRRTSGGYEPEPILSETYPADSYDPAKFPGLFGLAAGAKKETAA